MHENDLQDELMHQAVPNIPGTIGNPFGNQAEELHPAPASTMSPEGSHRQPLAARESAPEDEPKAEVSPAAAAPEAPEGISETEEIPAVREAAEVLGDGAAEVSFSAGEPSAEEPMGDSLSEEAQEHAAEAAAQQTEPPASPQEPLKTPQPASAGSFYYRPAVPGTVGNPFGSSPEVFQGRSHPVQEPSARQKKRSRHRWVAPVIILVLLLGIGLGMLLYHLFWGKKQESQPASTTPVMGDLSGRIVEQTREAGYLSPVDIYEQYAPSVVGIVSDSTTNVFGQETPIASSGTGFIISEDGYILTNYHVVEDTESITVTLYNRMEYPAELVGYENEISDIALLKIDVTGLTPVVFGDSNAARIGEEVSAIGNPLGELTFSMTVGHLSAKERAIPSNGVPIGMLQTDTAINSGNSGGPLFDCTGAVIGIVTAKYSGETSSGAYMEGLGFAIPINAVRNMLDDLQTLGYAAHRAYLGVRVMDSAAVQGKDLPHGAYVDSVEEGYCAEKAGIQSGDVIVGIDGKIVSSYGELVTSLQSCISGQTVEINLFRDGKYINVTLTLDARPQNNG